MKYIVLLLLVIPIGKFVYCQSPDLISKDSITSVYIDSITRIKLDKKLIKLTKKAVLKHGQDYYREFKAPVIHYKKVSQNTTDLTASEIQANEGKIYYTVEYPYDITKEVFYSNYSVKVYFWEDLSIFIVFFGNGQYIDYENISRQQKRKLTIPYKKVLPPQQIIDTIRDSNGNIIELKYSIKKNQEN